MIPERYQNALNGPTTIENSPGGIFVFDKKMFLLGFFTGPLCLLFMPTGRKGVFVSAVIGWLCGWGALLSIVATGSYFVSLRDRTVAEKRLAAETRKREEEAKQSKEQKEQLEREERKRKDEDGKHSGLEQVKMLEEEIMATRLYINQLLGGKIHAGFNFLTVRQTGSSLNTDLEEVVGRISKPLGVKNSQEEIDEECKRLTNERDRVFQRKHTLDSCANEYLRIQKKLRDERVRQEELARRKKCSDCDGEKNRLCSKCGGRKKIEVSEGVCDKCGGTGKVIQKNQCAECQGKGEYERRCPRCGGSGGRVCPNCRGKRSFDVTLSFKRRICDTCGGRGKVICDACSGRRKETVHCRKCDGVGFIETTVVCSSCKGTGNGRTKVDCPNCNGTGKEMCSVCSGRGFTYKEDSPSSVQKDAMDARAIVNPVTNASPASCR